MSKLKFTKKMFNGLHPMIAGGALPCEMVTVAQKIYDKYVEGLPKIYTAGVSTGIDDTLIWFKQDIPVGNQTHTARLEAVEELTSLEEEKK